jgi:hypothetical protein
MTNQILLYVASALPLVWGVAHLVPTKSVVAGFGDISVDNRRIITMEWITEGVSLIFIGVLLACVTYTDHTNVVSQIVYWTSFAVLIALSLVSLLTGFRIKFLPFRLCPVIFSGSAVLILLGNVL